MRTFGAWVTARSVRTATVVPVIIAIALGLLSWLVLSGGDLHGHIPTFVWVSGAAAIGCLALAWRGYRQVRCELIVDERGVRLASRTGEVIDFGHPKVTRGRFERSVKVPQGWRSVTILWVLVAPADGSPLPRAVFQQQLRRGASIPAGWPVAELPAGPESYTSLDLDVPALYEAASALASVA